jgi:hypothetical protein
MSVERKDIFHIQESQKPVGAGAERKFYEDPSNPERVIGIYRAEKESHPNEIKGRYYLTKILHILLPGNIPDVFMSTTEPNAIVRRKVELGKEHRAIQERRKIWESIQKIPDEINKEADSALGKIKNDPKVAEFRSRLYPLGIYVDIAPVNFGYDEKGNVQYVETVPSMGFMHGKFGPLFNGKELKKAIKRIKDKGERTKALVYLSRLKQLVKEEEKKIK